MKIAFMGTPDFSVPCLRALAESGHEIVGVFCQPDKPIGRKQELHAPAVKQEALRHGFRVLQPVSLRNGQGVALLRELQPELVIVTAYGKILPPDFLAFPKYGCINIHASLLPKYRGASPIHWAVMAGDTETGVTVMQMDEGMDTGDILLVKKLPIPLDATTEEMFERLSALGAKAMLEAIDALEHGTLTATPQNHAEATTVGLLTKEMGKIDWSASAFEIHNRIRGLYSWPGAYCELGGKRLKLHRARLTDKASNAAPGTALVQNGKLLVVCGDGHCVELLEVQPEGKKRMDAAAFLNGRGVENGEVFA